VVKFGGGWYGDAETEYDVAGYHFASNTTNVICVLENDNLLTLPEAYRNGILTEEDVANIAWLHYYGKYVSFSKPDQAESNEPKEDHVVLMPEEFPEEMRKAIEENGIQDTVWVANVNGRYLGVCIGQADEYMERILYDYYFGFPAMSNIYIRCKYQHTHRSLARREDNRRSILADFRRRSQNPARQSPGFSAHH
jgi:hypothetical protein